MSRKFSSVTLAFLGLWAFSLPAYAQTPATKPQVYTTAPKTVISRFKIGETEDTVRGMATLMVTTANENDTITGTLVLNLKDDQRQKLAQASKQPLQAIPITFIRKEVTAVFQSGTACPTLRLELASLEMPFTLTVSAGISGGQFSFGRLVLEIQETPAEMTQLFCNWSRQINVKRQRRGIIAAINRLLAGE